MAGNTAQADDDLCKECASLKLSVHDFLSSADNVSRNTRERTSFHKIALPATNILSGRRCRFCRFLIAAFVDCNPEALGKESPLWDGVDCTLEWVQDGRSIGQIGKNTALTRRLRLSTTNKSISDAYLVLMAPEGQSHRFLGRSINSLRIDVNMIRRWLRDCEMYHGTKCAPLSATSTERLLKNPRFRVIDVWSECVVTGINGPFIALSYVWGNVQPHRLTKSNAHQFFRPGALTKMSSQILRTIKDALEVTKQLGYRYIWIDSYCIIQDDVDDITTMIQLMDMIYTAASLTICAAEGAAAHSGISGILAANRNSPQITVQYEKDVCLMASESAESYIARSVWNSRAWTFQERLCSTRSLVFAEGRAFFQCRTSSMREDIHMESTTSNDYDSGWSLELKDVPGRLFSENPLRQYTRCTELFTERKMAYDDDKLKAFSAIQSILSTNMTSDFHFALPTAYFDFALLWTPLTPTRRLPGFPSWSWCGWGAKVEYKYQTLEGVFANLHEWCNTRTWITWYGKASQSDRFEYVWDGRRGGVPGRWSGYTVQQKGWSRKHPWDQRPRQGRMSYGPRFKSLDGPELLFFRTHSAYFRIDPTPQSSPSSRLDSMSHTSPRNDQLKPGVNWHNLSDCNGDWCGTVLLAAETISAISLEASELIAISEARDFSLEEHDSWTFYVAKDRVDSLWDLYYVLLITTNEKGVSERIGFGKIFKDAFKRSLGPGASWKEIVLG